MAADMRAGLAVDGGNDPKMILSYVDAPPTGKEKGLLCIGSWWHELPGAEGAIRWER